VLNKKIDLKDNFSPKLPIRENIKKIEKLKAMQIINALTNFLDK